MRFRFVTSTLAFAVLATSVASAQMASSSSTNPFANDYFNGTWTCTTTKDPDKKMVGKSETMTTAAVGKHWQRITLPEGQIWITRDPKLKKYVSEYIGDDGSYGMGETTGWTGNTLVVKDTVNAGNAPLGVLTFTKKSASEYTNTYVVKTPKGTMTSEGTCKKKA
jgi:hypothetical protein